ncbi:MAG: adenylyltransferase/cytidyltransferase family protein [Chloroflexi bacterium]|nr:adenylyltransferase/cytidyltransferase family protein [Chloroflexota bacterium]
MNSQSTMPAALVQRIHDSDMMAVISVAGAGSAAISWLLGVAGASRTVLEILVPYASSSLTDFVGGEPQQFVSEDTAVAMAKSAYRRALHLREGGAPVVGIACTATIATDRTKRGDHRCHIAAWSAVGVATYNLTFVKELRDRAGEDAVASMLVLRALSDAACLPFDDDLHLDTTEYVESNGVQYADPIDALMAGHIGKAVVHPDGSMRADEPFHGGILSGSFNPLHEGHAAMVKTASEMLDKPVVYELSVANADKPPLEAGEVRRRVAQFTGAVPIVLTGVPVFYKKAELLPGCTFIIGVDTAVRLFDKKYYSNSKTEMLLALQQMREHDCDFLVAGRVDGNTFHTLADVRIPDGFEPMFTPIPESAFRSDISSTEIRAAGVSGSRAAQ